MLCKLLILVSILALSAAFRGTVPTIRSRSSRSFQLQAHVLDGVTIDGDLTPISNNLLIKVKDIKAATQGGIYIPDQAKERPTEGTVIAAGPGRVHPETGLQLDIACKVGQNVLYGKYDGSELRYDDINHQLIKDDDVLLTYEGEEALLENVECVKDQVLIKLPEKEEASGSGLIISTPGEEGKRPNYGTVAKIGPGRQAGGGNRMPIQVKPGDGVRFREYGGAQIKLGTDEYVVMRAYDILAIW
mmetsp:Transcript_3580/g.5901  ORF Transcript_3580/g.5901 Transcript_3580/m.5901 type:complete len:245 (-) Transcript_3580:58-792(-)|eukprot:CAMPEP_0174998900 /NCGR_PEP_ID=MMETSP0005-20121125/1758_1 /TAXON_ID=420556 /ORGANISM="Ochromonas sp., Strain CCMP1393" /LENGTH=244 /DNA_ID=CAMNT_0016253573 /DNA_START=40 /DNA_END=771 /DNA_ORIENTATION=-